MSEIDRSVLLDVALLDSEQSLMWFSAVHLLAMTTVVSNPILYGWLNTNPKHLFRAMIPYVRDRVTHAINSNADDNGQIDDDEANVGLVHHHVVGFALAQERSELVERNEQEPVVSDTH